MSPSSMPKTRTRGKKAKTIAQTLLLLSTLALALNPHITNADNNTIYIREDGSIDPPTASIQRNGYIYTFVNGIFESIVVQRSNIIINGNNLVLQGNGTGKGLQLYNTQNVTIRNMRIRQFSQGVSIQSSTNSAALNNTITNCTYGIIIDQSPDNTITNNIVENNKMDGIFITASPRVTIINNTVTNNDKWGIYLGYSNDSKLRNNTMRNNRYNFGVSVDFSHDIDISNTINSRPIYYWTSQENRQVPTDAGFIALINSHNINVQNLDLCRNGDGVLLVDSENNFIENSNITSNGYYGIQLINSRYNFITNNTIIDNGFGGISLISSTSNTIINNTIKSNQQGIALDNSDSNTICQNNFLNNTYQVFNKNSINIWDNGLPQSGNYWSDYAGKDIDGDGTGDIPYIIDETNQDKYPLMHPIQKIIPSRGDNPTPIFIAIATLAAIAIGITIYFVKNKNLRHSKSSYTPSFAKANRQ